MRNQTQLKISPEGCLVGYYGVCPMGMITGLSLEIWEIFNQVGSPIQGLNGVIGRDPFANESFESRRTIPPIVVAGFNVIINKINKLNKSK